MAHTLRLTSDDGKAEQKAGATVDPDVLGSICGILPFPKLPVQPNETKCKVVRSV